MTKIDKIYHKNLKKNTFCKVVAHENDKKTKHLQMI